VAELPLLGPVTAEILPPLRRPCRMVWPVFLDAQMPRVTGRQMMH